MLFFSCFRVFKVAALLTTASIIATSAQAGYWTNSILYDNDIDQAKAWASKRYHYYSECSRLFKESAKGQHEQLASYIKQYHPELNAELIYEGFGAFFEGKKDIWLWKSENTNELCARWIEYHSKIANGEISPTLDGKSDWLIKKTNELAEWVYPRQLALNQLKVVRGALLDPSQKGKRVGLNDIEEKNILNYIDSISSMIRLKNETKKFKNLHAWLQKELQQQMGIEPKHLSTPFKKPSVAVIVDVDFKRDITENDKPRWVEMKPPSFPWKEGDSFEKALPWAHGDLMVAIGKVFSPFTTIHRSYCPSHEGEGTDLEKDFVEQVALFETLETQHYSIIKSPIVFNFSWTPAGRPSYYIQETNQGLQLQRKEVERTKRIDVKNWFEDLNKKFPNKNWDKVLDKEQTEYLEEDVEIILRAAHPVELFTESLVKGKPHMIVVGPSNQSGPLTKKNVHNGWIELLARKITKQHAIVPLNYDPFTGKLEAHSAGAYKDMVVLVPAAYMSVDFGDEFIPYFYRGGNSSAAAILSSLISSLRGHFPELDHTEVRTAILQGANKNIPGYDLKLHGQGMINWKGAFAVAEKIVAEKQKEETFTSSTNHTTPSKPVATPQNPNAGRPLPKIPPKKETNS